MAMWHILFIYCASSIRIKRKTGGEFRMMDGGWMMGSPDTGSNLTLSLPFPQIICQTGI